MTSKLKALAIVAALLSTGAASASPTTEWRILGPAFSHHFSDANTRVLHPAREATECDAGNGAQVYSPTPLPVPWMLIRRTDDGGYLYGTSGVSTCVTKTIPAERGWQERNPALGVEVTLRSEDHADKLLLTAVRDSYDTQSVMLAAGRQWPLGKLGTVSFDAGVVGGVWRRSVLERDGENLERRWVPFVLPSMSINEAYTGLGVNVGFAPEMRVNGRYVNRTPTLMLQTTYLVRESRRGWTAFRLGTEGGGVQASVASSF